LRITLLEIKNLFSYKKANIRFESFNVLVGPNAAGKTNVNRILEFLHSGTVEVRRLPLNLKFDKSLPSSLRIDMLLAKHEAKMLFELIFNKKLQDCLFAENATCLSFSLEWTKRYEDNSPPDIVILYLHNGLRIRNDGARIHITYFRPSENIEDLKSDIDESIAIENDEVSMQKYRDQKGFTHSYLFAQNSFQNALLKDDQIEHFFELEGKKIRITQNNFSINYRLDSTDNEKEHVVEIFGFLGKELSTGYSPNLWSLINRYFESITIQAEIRPRLQDLAKNLLELKSHDLERYMSINNEFSTFFPDVSFNAQPPENAQQDPRIEIREKNRCTGIIRTFDLQSSAAGYSEVIALLLEMSERKGGVLVLDEPALRLHPNTIRLLARVLAESERQILLVSHSPYFVDISALGPTRKLLYVKKMGDGSSEVFPRSCQQAPNRHKSTIKSYLFNPDILFSKYIILVEGSGEVGSFYAISDSLDSVFERYNIVVMNANGHGNIDPYVEFMTKYQIPYVAMVDIQYTTRGEFVRRNKICRTLIGFNIRRDARLFKSHFSMCIDRLQDLPHLFLVSRRDARCTNHNTFFYDCRFRITHSSRLRICTGTNDWLQQV
jgi:predicted ATP-dependent endonuclease of OLD family